MRAGQGAGAPGAGNKPVIGAIEWLRPGEHERVEMLLDDLRSLGITTLRTHFSWADWHAPGGQAWYDWLLPRLAAAIELIPCFMYTPPSLGVEPKTAAPPRDSKAFADFIDVIISRQGECFQWIELWNEPNNLVDWDWRMDPEWRRFAEMIKKAAYWAKQRGKKTLLGGMCPTDPNWLDLMARLGALADIDAIGIHGFPGTWEFDWRDWHELTAKVQRVLRTHGLDPALWITEAGYSTWRFDEFRQLQTFVDLLQAPVERVYWYSLYDLHPERSHQQGFHEDERHYHFGLKRADGVPKLLYRVWRDQGVPGVQALVRKSSRGEPLTRQPRTAATLPHQRPVLITGGAGFIGTNLAAALLYQGKEVMIMDNLARPGVERNMSWLRQRFGERLQLAIADVRDPHLTRAALQQASQVYHLAAQVAVTTSLARPHEDFAINTEGTFNVLEAQRRCDPPPPLVFTSTNKVYGALEHLALASVQERYQPVNPTLACYGLSEDLPLSFYSPYGCSKGAADQYVLDYARSYAMPAVVFRMSCIYGPHQHGTEDQGWIAHFLIRALKGESITLFGDGKQVRDVLFVSDLVRALLLAQIHMESIQGQVFNIGGGAAQAVSLLEVIKLISSLGQLTPRVQFAPWRIGDQRYYVADTRKFAAATGWAPQVNVKTGVTALAQWLQTTPEDAEALAAPSAGVEN